MIEKIGKIIVFLLLLWLIIKSLQTIGFNILTDDGRLLFMITLLTVATFYLNIKLPGGFEINSQIKEINRKLDAIITKAEAKSEAKIENIENQYQYLRMDNATINVIHKTSDDNKLPQDFEKSQ